MPLPENMRILGLLPDQIERLFYGLIVLGILLAAVLLIFVLLKRSEKMRARRHVENNRKMQAMRKTALGRAEEANMQVSVSIARGAGEELKRNVLAMIARNPEKAVKVVQKMMYKKHR